MIIAFVIWSIVALIFVGIGISCRNSEKAVGFFTGVKAPDVENVKQYNRSVSVLWFVVAIVLEIIGVPFLCLEQNSPYFVFMILPTMACVIGMVIAYLKIESKYRKR